MARKREADELEKAAESKKDESRARAEQSEAIKETVEVVRENEVKLEVAESKSEDSSPRAEEKPDPEKVSVSGAGGSEQERGSEQHGSHRALVGAHGVVASPPANAAGPLLTVAWRLRGDYPRMVSIWRLL